MALPSIRHCLACLVALATLTAAALGQDQPAAASQPEPAVRNRTLIQKLIERVETLEVELKKLRQAGKTVVPTDPAKQRVVAMVESVFLGAPYYRTTGNRFLAAKLVLVNLTNAPLTVARQATRLKVDDKQHVMPTAIPSTIRAVSFQVGNQSFQMSSLKWLNELTLPAGGSGSTWVIFPQLT